jgi:hypothetical protein
MTQVVEQVLSSKPKYCHKVKKENHYGFIVEAQYVGKSTSELRSLAIPARSRENQDRSLNLP